MHKPFETSHIDSSVTMTNEFFDAVIVQESMQRFMNHARGSHSRDAGNHHEQKLSRKLTCCARLVEERILALVLGLGLQNGMVS
jgi:hypothetical protein